LVLYLFLETGMTYGEVLAYQNSSRSDENSVSGSSGIYILTRGDVQNLTFDNISLLDE
jgi:hypothetical protein